MSQDVDNDEDDDFTEEMMNERICQNCTYFFHHNDDDDSMGICSKDEDFSPYMADENLLENMDFSICRKLYLKKCFDGQRDACETFENAWVKIPDGIRYDSNLRLEALKDFDSKELFQRLNQSDREITQRALGQIKCLIYSDNTTAGTNLTDYYQALGPATTLEEVGFRIELVELLSFLPKTTQIIDAYVQELARTPSNNVTRKLYTKILSELSRFTQEEICAPLEKLLSDTPYSYKIKRRIKEVAGLVEPEDSSWFY